VNVATSGHQYVVERRYTDFEELHKQVLYLPCTCACACTFVYANLRAHKLVRVRIRVQVSVYNSYALHPYNWCIL